HPIELRELSREQPRVPSKRHDVGAELQPTSAPGGESQAEQWVAERPEREVGEPERVEAELLAGRDVVGKRALVEREARRCDGEPDLHGTYLASTGHSQRDHRGRLEELERAAP